MNKHHDTFMGFLEDGEPKPKGPQAYVDYRPDAKPKLVATMDNRTNRFTVKWWNPDPTEWRALLDGVKAIPGRLFEPKAKHWTVPNEKACKEALQKLGFKLELDPNDTLGGVRPQNAQVSAEKWEEPWKDIELRHPYPEGLRHYQVEALKFLTYRNGRGLIGDEMGTGKTISALGWQAMNYARRPVLIVVMVSTKLQWARQVKKWVGIKEPVTILEGRTPYDLNPEGTYIINWDILADWAGYEDANHRWVLSGPLAEVGWQMIIGDEIQAIGNPSAKRTKAFRALAKRTPHFIGLSGTPIRTRPAQFYPILNLIDPKTFSNHQKFLNRYCDPKHNGFAVEYKGASNMEELHSLIRPLMIRRLKSEVMKELPPKVIEAIPVQADPTLVAKYQQLEEEFWNGIAGAGGIVEQKARAARLQRSAYIAKEKGCLNWIEEFLSSTEDPLVVFYWHKAVGSILEDTFKKYGVAKVDGEVVGAKRDAQIEQFRSKRARIFLGNIQACGVGIDGLQDVCSHMVFVEYAPSPTDHAQAEDRLHRSGQTQSVNIYYLVAPGTVDEDMVEILDSRRKMITQVVDGEIPPDMDFLGELLARRGRQK